MCTENVGNKTIFFVTPAGKEAVETDKDRARIHSARMRQIVRDMTAGTEQRLETLEENVKSLSELLKEKDGNKVMETRAIQDIETLVKQLKASFENSVKDVEVEEMEHFGKERDQMDYCEKIPGKRKMLIVKSSDCNNDTVLNETASCENELAADRKPNAVEPDDFPVSLGRQEMQSKFEGNQSCSEYHKLEEELGAPKTEMEEIKLKHNKEMKTLETEEERKANARLKRLDSVRVKYLEEEIDHLKTEMEQLKLKHNEEKKTLVAEKQNRDAKLREANTRLERLDTVRVKELEEELHHVKTEMAHLKFKHNEEKKTLVAEKQNREARLTEANARLVPVRVNELKQVIENLREEKKEIESQLLSDKKRIERELHEKKKSEVKVKRKTERLTKENEDFLKD